MDNGDDQVSRLALADRQINDGRRRNAVQIERVRKLREKGIDTASAEQPLRIMQDALKNFLELRELIERSRQLRGS